MFGKLANRHQPHPNLWRYSAEKVSSPNLTRSMNLNGSPYRKASSRDGRVLSERTRANTLRVRSSSWARCLSPMVLPRPIRSEEHTSELQSRENLVCRLLLEKKKKYTINNSRNVS